MDEYWSQLNGLGLRWQFLQLFINSGAIVAEYEMKVLLLYLHELSVAGIVEGGAGKFDFL